MHIGVYLSFNGEPYYNNNGEIIITEIGTTKGSVTREGAPLLCYTDNLQCCNNSELGRWFLPDGSVIGTESEAGDFYIDRDQSVVRLNRRNNATSPTGTFCCEIPNAKSVNTKVCANIGELIIIKLIGVRCEYVVVSPLVFIHSELSYSW